MQAPVPPIAAVAGAAIGAGANLPLACDAVIAAEPARLDPRLLDAGTSRALRCPPNGGPGCYITFAEYDHRGYKGDFLTIRELRGGDLHFRGYHRPQWPSNTHSPILSDA